MVVCIKQVPDAAQVEIDPERGTLRRETADAKLNVYDAHALEAAVTLKEARGGRVTAISMGPPQAEAVIREAFTLGADDGLLLSDPAFAGADTLATAFTLARAIQGLDFDLILCGMQTTDGDTGQVGPAVAELLGIPHVSFVQQMETLEARRLLAAADLQDRLQRVAVALPCVLTVTREANQPRLPSLRRKLEVTDRQVPVIGQADLQEPGQEEAWFGLEGSATRVERIFPPESHAGQERWEGPAPELAESMHRKLQELKLL